MSNREPREPQGFDYEAYLEERAGWLDEAVVTLGGESGTDPYEFFPKPGEVRREDSPTAMTPDQEARLREIAGRFGIGGEVDITADDVDTHIIEGGLAWKVDAEARISNPRKAFIFAGSPNRKITRDDEIEYMKAKLGDERPVGETEYDIVRQVAESQPGFVPLEHDMVLDFGYELEEGFPVVNSATGQLAQIGLIKGLPVILLRVDRKKFIDDEGEEQKIQPDAAALMVMHSDILDLARIFDESIGLITSNTYSSRSIDLVRAGLLSGRRFEVGMYGRRTLAEVKGEPEPEPTEVNQIPGELHVIASRLRKLKAELADLEQG